MSTSLSFSRLVISLKSFYILVNGNSLFSYLLNFLRYFCRSLIYDPISKYCVLSSEDSTSMSEQEMASLTGTGYHYYEVMCMGLGSQ